MPQPNDSHEPPAAKLMQLITGHWVAAAIYCTAKPGLADELTGGPRSSDEIAKSVKVNASSLQRLMRALTILNVFEETDAGYFTLTELGNLLRSDHPQSMRSLALFQGSSPHWRSWGACLHSVQTGKPAFEYVHNQTFFDYCQTDREFADAFNGAMTALSGSLAEEVVEAYDFSNVRKLVDVGGGHGVLLATILRRYPQMRGVILDLPNVVEGAKSISADRDLANRCELVGGSFFESVPPADTYIAKNIIHDWDDAHAGRILGNIRAAMEPSGKVLLVEIVLGTDNRNVFANLLDLEMLNATHGGRERTADEFRGLFASAGLQLNRIVPTKSAISVLEAVTR